MSAVQTRWLVTGAATPPLHVANPVQSAPPTTAPASSGMLPHVASTATQAAHASTAPRATEVDALSSGRTRPRQNNSSPGTTTASVRTERAAVLISSSRRYTAATDRLMTWCRVGEVDDHPGRTEQQES